MAGHRATHDEQVRRREKKWKDEEMKERESEREREVRGCSLNRE